MSRKNGLSVDTLLTLCDNRGALGYYWDVFKSCFLRQPTLLSGLCLTLLTSAAQAAAHRQHHPRPAPVPAPAPQVQVDGIVDGVVDQLWRQTDRYWHGGDYPRIIALDRIITQADPQFLEAYSTGGWLMDSLGRTKDAEAFYTLATRNNPKAAYAYSTLGFFYFNTTHDYQAAARAFGKDTQQADADLNDWKMLAHAQEHAGQWDAAVATWHQIKARWPNGMSVDRLLREAEEKRRRAQADGKLPMP